MGDSAAVLPRKETETAVVQIDILCVLLNPTARGVVLAHQYRLDI